MNILEYKTTKLVSFTAEQLNVFDFLVGSFPEEMLLISATEGDDIDEDISSVLALMAYDIGASRDMINNLRYAKDIPYLYNSVKSAGRFAANDEILILLNAHDLGDLLFDDNMTIEKKLEITKDSDNYFKNAYSYITKRGTLGTLKKIIADYLVTSLDVPENSVDLVSQDAAEFTVEDDGSGGKNIKINVYVEDDIDKTNDLTVELSGDYFGLRKDSEIYKIITSVRPAGILYTIGMLYKANILQNMNTPVFDSVHYDGLSIALDDGIDVEPDPVITGSTYIEVTGYVVYTVTLTNPYKHIPVVLRLRDFDNTGYNNSESKNLTHHEVVIGPGETITDYELTTINTYGADVDVYIAGYFESYDGGSETMYNTADAESSFTTPATGGGSPPILDPATLIAYKKTAIAGGYVELRITNPNSVSVTAEILIDWTSENYTGDSSRIVTVPGNSMVIENRYNVLSEMATAEIDVTLSAPGYNDSVVAEITVFAVVKRYLG